MSLVICLHRDRKSNVVIHVPSLSLFIEHIHLRHHHPTLLRRPRLTKSSRLCPNRIHATTSPAYHRSGMEAAPKYALRNNGKRTAPCCWLSPCRSIQYPSSFVAMLSLRRFYALAQCSLNRGKRSDVDVLRFWRSLPGLTA